MRTLAKPPIWFWIVAAVLLLWGIVGVAGFVIDVTTTPAMRARTMSSYDQQLYAARPVWTLWVYGIATVAGLLGSVALLARRAIARPIYVVSLIGVVVLFGWMLGTTDLIAVKGFVGAAGFPIVIALIGAFEIWLSGVAIRRGWIG